MNINIHHRRTIRLKGYDYSQSGMYYVTICCHNKTAYFGDIENKKMMLNDAGKMVEKWCKKISRKFSNMTLDPYIIMPNHFHAIIVNTVGADPRVCPDKHGDMSMDEYTDVSLGEYGNVSLGKNACEILGEHDNKIMGEHMGSPLHGIVQWFKTMTTNEYMRGVKTLGWQPFNKKLWQRNYYEHIIRDMGEYQYIVNYIINNPANWGKDKFYEL